MVKYLKIIRFFGNTVKMKYSMGSKDPCKIVTPIILALEKQNQNEKKPAPPRRAQTDQSRRYQITTSLFMLCSMHKCTVTTIW
jgi:hypothetical protein